MHRDDNKPGPRVVNEDAVAALLPKETPTYGFDLLDDFPSSKWHGLIMLERVALCATSFILSGFCLAFGGCEQLYEEGFRPLLLNERLAQSRKTEPLTNLIVFYTVC